MYKAGEVKFISCDTFQSSIIVKMFSDKHVVIWNIRALLLMNFMIAIMSIGHVSCVI